MKLNVIIAVLLTVAVFIGIPVSSWAQSTLLPEKTTEAPADNTSDNSVTSAPVPVDATASTTTQGVTVADNQDTVSWGYLIAALIFVALLLLFLEIAVIPGFGVCGISGIILLIGGLALAYCKLSMNMAVIATVVAVAGVMLLIAFVIWVFPHTGMGRRFVLSETAPVADENEDRNCLNRFLGAEGVATSYLRPSGIAKIADERVDVITEGDFVEKGTKIKVIKVTANRVIVAPIEE